MVEDRPVASLSSCLPHLFHLSAPPSRGWNPPGEMRFQLEMLQIVEILGQEIPTFHRSRGSGKGKESEYENGESDCPDDEEVHFHFIKTNDCCKKMVPQTWE